MHKYPDIQGHTYTRQTHGHTFLRETPAHTLLAPHTHTHSNKPLSRPGSPAAVAHPIPPTPPRGRRCPRGNRGLRSLLKPRWLPRDINSPLAAAGSSELGAGGGPAPGTDTSALVGRTERGSLVRCPSSGSNHWFSQRPLLRLRRYVGLGRPGPGRGAVRARPGGRVGCLREHRHGALAEARPHSLPGQFCGLLTQGSTGLGHSLASPVVTFSAPRKARG